MAQTKDQLAAKKRQWGQDNKVRIAAQKREYDRTPEGRFTRHKANAKRDGKVFLLSFDEWYSLWSPFDGVDGLVMCRTNDQGPYELGNVRIDTISNNVKERHSVALYRQD